MQDPSILPGAARRPGSDFTGIPTENSVGPFVTEATRELGDITGDVWSSVFTDKLRSGEGSGLHGLRHHFSGRLRLHDVGAGRGRQYGDAQLHGGRSASTYRTQRVEFMQYEPFLVGRGIEIDLNAETSVPGTLRSRRPGRKLPRRYRRGSDLRLDCRREAPPAGPEGILQISES